MSLAAESQVFFRPSQYMLDSTEAMHKLLSFGTQNIKNPYQNTSRNTTTPLTFTNNNFIEKQTSIICFDTAARFFWRNDSIYFGVNHPYITQSGDVLLTGFYQKSLPPYQTGLVVFKTDVNGNLLWGKRYDSINNITNNYSDYYRTIELIGGTLLFAGRTNNRVSGNNDLLITKTDNIGNIIWSKTYKSTLWGQGSGSSDYFYVQQIKQDPSSGDVYFTGPFWSDGRGLVRLNSVNGDIIWSKAYNSGSAFDNSFGLDIRPQEIRLFGRTLNYSQTKADVSIYRISKVNGDTINTRFFTTNDTNGIKTNFLSQEPLQVTNDGHYLLAGRPFGSYQYLWNGTTPLFQGSVAEFDSSLNFVKAYCFQNFIESNGYNTRVTTFPDKTGVFSMFAYISSYTADVYINHFNNNQIIKQRRKHYAGEGISYEPLAAQLPNGGTMTIKLLGDSAANLNKIEFLKTYPSDTSSSCIGYNDNSTSIYSFGYIPLTYNQAGVIKSNIFVESINKTFFSTSVPVQLSPACFQISHCDTLKILTPFAVICQSQALQITTRKNVGCGANIIWQYPNNIVSSVQQQNDSSYSFNFTGSWSGYLYGTIQGCNLIKDSIFITVLQAPAFLNIGPDTSICPANTIILNAHTGYSSYLWQNGSTDSIYTVTAPGIYYVKTTDACGGVFRDTVNVRPRSIETISIGPDRNKCNNDTIHLSMPDNFISYGWLPNYNISSINAQMVTVNPFTNTTYYARAEKSPGCFSFDTVHITVYNSPIINLGKDTSICLGQSLNFDAGTGFTNYLWSNGSLTQQINVNTTGTYYVNATTINNCISKDTIILRQVYALPIVQLNHSTELCIGSSKIFDGGIFASYLWQDNSTHRTFTANNLGIYYVTVTDIHNCKASDTARITSSLPLPTDFLPLDTAICNYSIISLQATSSFANYMWSNGIINAKVVIDKPGLYWLEVKDNKGCIGRDSIKVLLKQCMNGLFVPNAFTPDGNGKNDRLKALLFGNISSVEFNIYNKYGQLLFRTTDINQGWDGIFKGIAQKSGTYVWTCKFAIDSSPIIQQQGTVILIR